MARILIAYASIEGQTARIAARLAERLQARGHAAELREAAAGFDAWACDGLIIGASVHYGAPPRWLRAALRRERQALAARTGAFFSVCLSMNPAYGEKFLQRAGWRPQQVATFAGALRYSQYGWFKRRLIQGFARVGGHSTDASRDHEYTDWAAVERFADAFAARL
jgi:menaquinone-dependent protoporphyrinogen oxidase